MDAMKTKFVIPFIVEWLETYAKNAQVSGFVIGAIVPFYGQGMNASFEDVVEFDRFLDLHNGDWKTTLKAFEAHRKVDTDAIADLAIDNFHEMKDHIANPLFQEKRKIEMALESEFPYEYYSKYSLVTFKETIGYNEAMTVGRAQDKAILSLLSAHKIDASENLNELLKKVQKETSEILREDTIAKTLDY